MLLLCLCIWNFLLINSTGENGTMLAKGSVTKKDVRLNKRRDIITENVIKKESLIQIEVGGSRTGELAMKDFLRSNKVSPDYIIGPAILQTADAVEGLRIAAPQDTTEINFSGRDKRRKGFGPGGDGKTPGFFIHASIAVDIDSEAVLGPASVQIWTRSDGPARNLRTTPFEEKESLRWLKGAQFAAERLVKARQVIVVGDQESDIYEVFARRPEGLDFVIRACQNRGLEDGSYLYTVAAPWKELGEQQVFVSPKRRGDKGRVATVKVKSGQIAIKKPGMNSAKTDPKSVVLNMVEACEVGAPQNVEPLLWRLLTTLPATTFADAREVIRVYRLRWRIEQLFRTLKTDGLDLGATQIIYAKSIFNLAAFGVIASCRIMQLVDARDGGDRPATDVIQEDQIEDVEKIAATLEGATERQKNPWEKGTLSRVSWVAARLGGWNCCGRKAGPKRMARGWRRLSDRLEGMALARLST